MIAHIRKISGITAAFAVLALVFSLWTSSVAGAVTIDPNAKAEPELFRELSRRKILLDEEFTITYKIQPKPIPASVVQPPDKEIYMVLDTSGSMEYNLAGKSLSRGSMEKKRIDIAREAAFKFLDNLSGKSGVYVGLITYSDIGMVKQSLTSNLQLVKSSINNINAVGGTNIGDGLRLGYYRLSRSTNINADKYLILLTDGEPTYHSIYKKPSTRFFKEDGTAPDFKGGGSVATPEDIRYCYEIAEELLKPSDIKSYMIAFTVGSNANVLNEVAQKAGGVYKQALDSDALENVYNEIYEEIIVDFSVENIRFEEKFPEGLTVVSVPEGFSIIGRTVTGSIPGIDYAYNSATGYYEANPVEFVITLKGSSGGIYSLGSSKLFYEDFDNSSKTMNFNDETLEVVALNAKIKVDRNISKNEMLVNEEFNVNYIIIPEEFGIDHDLVPPGQLTVKNISFSEEFPERLTVVSADRLNITGRHVEGNLGEITYTYDSSEGKYKANPVSFTITLKGEEGNFILGKDNASKISYYDLDKNINEKSFPELNPRILKFGNPKLEVVKVNRRGEVVDITLKVTLPKRTKYSEIRLPVINEDGSVVKENGGLIKKMDGRTEVYTVQFEYTNLSIYKTHRVWLWAVSDFDTGTTSETDIITIFEAININ